mmetsp:Transcript_22190/g.68314  ORF Transcript_22190/g.68314 Transcript_22190/m.68314 type:complete len:218 (+) Transcript_22190:130-783(+)
MPSRGRGSGRWRGDKPDRGTPPPRPRARCRRRRRESARGCLEEGRRGRRAWPGRRRGPGSRGLRPGPCRGARGRRARLAGACRRPRDRGRAVEVSSLALSQSAKQSRRGGRPRRRRRISERTCLGGRRSRVRRRETTRVRRAGRGLLWARRRPWRRRRGRGYPGKTFLRRRSRRPLSSGTRAPSAASPPSPRAALAGRSAGRRCRLLLRTRALAAAG